MCCDNIDTRDDYQCYRQCDVEEVDDVAAIGNGEMDDDAADATGAGAAETKAQEQTNSVDYNRLRD